MRAKARERFRRAETRAIACLRSRPARYIGTGVAIAALAMLASRLLQDPATTWRAVRQVGIVGVLVSLAGLAGFHVGAIRCLSALHLDRAPQIWAQAQLLKYLPVPASAVAGFVGSAVQQGHGARDAVRGLILHTLTLVVGAMVVAGGLVVAHAPGVGVPAVMGMLAIGAAVAGGTAWALVRRRAVPPQALMLAVGAWASVGVGFGVGLGDSPPEWLTIGSAYAAAWVIGQLAIPVPAGLGVREAAFALLVAPTLPAPEALVTALLSRILHASSDGIAALLAGSIGPRRLSTVEPDR